MAALFVQTHLNGQIISSFFMLDEIQICKRFFYVYGHCAGKEMVVKMGMPRLRKR